jgi:hypothetical protein
MFYRLSPFFLLRSLTRPLILPFLYLRLPSPVSLRYGSSIVAGPAPKVMLPREAREMIERLSPSKQDMDQRVEDRLLYNEELELRECTFRPTMSNGRLAKRTHIRRAACGPPCYSVAAVAAVVAVVAVAAVCVCVCVCVVYSSSGLSCMNMCMCMCITFARTRYRRTTVHGGHIMRG